MLYADVMAIEPLQLVSQASKLPYVPCRKLPLSEPQLTEPVDFGEVALCALVVLLE